ncbi:MAG: SusC/RagA family TonB-linked outer membrane protein [Sphingobacterium sp.]
MNTSKNKLIAISLPFSLTLLILLFADLARSQDRQISGYVHDESGKAIVGATIKLQDGSVQVSSDDQGAFLLRFNGAMDRAVVSHLGYLPQTITLAGRTELEIIMQPDDSTIDEVVVVGYGTVRKSDLTGAVASVPAEELTKGANLNLQQALQGRTPGVQIAQKSGEPGAAMSVQIRGVTSITGNNAPLYVIDGMPVNDAAAIGSAGVGGATNNPNNRNPLNALNVSDIASIEILKDASATAIYGSRGANGVVLITTKKGQEGNLTLDYNASFGSQQIANTQRFMTGQEYTETLNGIIEEGDLNPNVYHPVDGENHNTDWQGLLLRNAGVQTHDFSFSGGNPTTKYYIAGGYFDQDGVMLNSGTTRYNGTLNVQTSVPSKYNIGMSLSTAYTDDAYNANGVGINDNASALYMAQNYDPTAPAYSADGEYFRSPLMAPMDNPLAVIHGQYSKGETFRTFGNVFAEYFLLPSLSAKARVGVDLNNTKRTFWIDPSTLTGASYGGYADVRDGKRGYYLLEGTLNYQETWANHQVNAVLGATYERYTSSSLTANARSFSLADLTYYGLGSGDATLNRVGYGAQENVLLSYLGRINYTYKNRYLLTGSFRADGSARFGPENRFGYFPSIALAWKLQEENFLQNAVWINDLKIRASYGAIGNQPNVNYLYFSTYAAGRNAIFDGERVTTIAPTRSANPFLRWESAEQFDLGLDFSFWENRLSGSLDYYDRRTSHLLYNVPQPLSTGFNARTENVGSMRNSGMELTVNGSLIDHNAFQWNASFNLTTLKNRVISLGSVEEFIGTGPGNIGQYSILKPGESIGSYYGYLVDGVWQIDDDFSLAQPGVRPGDLKYHDLDNNQVINTDDRVILGKALPDFFYGLNTDVSYKNLNLAIFLEGSQGAKMLNSSRVDSYYPVDFRRNKLAALYLNRWTAQNPTNDYPSFIPGDVQGSRNVTDKTVEDASYLRLQSIRLSYKIPLLENKYIRSATVFVNGQNLHTWTKYSGVDPAVNAIGDNVLRVDYNSYPLTRTFTAGVNLQF